MVIVNVFVFVDYGVSNLHYICYIASVVFLFCFLITIEFYTIDDTRFLMPV